MGDIRVYKCEKCDYELTFRIGSGFLYYEEYNKKIKKCENKLKKEIENGEYGDLLRAMLKLPESKFFVFDCNESIFQCSICKYVGVHNKKEILSDVIRKYTQRIIFNQRYPECNCNFYKDVFESDIYCPKCKNNVMHITSFGNWD